MDLWNVLVCMYVCMYVAYELRIYFSFYLLQTLLILYVIFKNSS
jgi:hypothetical protein